MNSRGPVTAPRAVPPRVGLVVQARNVAGEGEDGTKWQAGFEYAPEGCGGAGVTDPCDNALKDIPDPPAIVAAEPFNVWAGDRCSPFGFDSTDYERRARDLLESCESQQIEAEFWKGTQAQASSWDNRFLTEGAEVVNAAAIAPVEALATLEDGLALCSCGARGFIHATRGVVALWASFNLLRREGPNLLTIVDTVVVPGSGYDGSGPGDAPPADGSVWAYATGPVDVRRDEIQIVPGTFAEALDRNKNTVEFRAERLAAATWDGCCHLAVEIDAPAPPVAIGS